jgi:U4/U6.U5 tri-snRNP-associated protein 3
MSPLATVKPVPTKALSEVEEREKEERMRRLQEEIMQDDKKAERELLEAINEGAPKDLDSADLEGKTEDEQMMMLMGFGGFGSTKGQKVEDNHTGAAKGATASKKERKYRQYMNRKGGFNRPLDQMK